MIIKDILDDLKKEIEYMESVFSTEDWKFYKFGRGGPYYSKLIEMTEKCIKSDEKLRNHFKLKKDTASYGTLIVLCMGNDIKERTKSLNRFKRQINHMREKLNERY